jgi:shikimate dehydrogenase
VVLNRSEARAEALAAALGSRLQAGGLAELEGALSAADLVVNATSAELGGGAALDMDWASARAGAVAMDMVYRPLETVFLAGARAQGLTGVDGLEMLIGQARPSFEAFFGLPAPEAVDVRGLALEALAAG